MCFNVVQAIRDSLAKWWITINSDDSKNIEWKDFIKPQGNDHTVYHMTLRKGVCLNHQSTVNGGLAKSSYIFYNGKNSLIYSLFCSIYSICGERGWLKSQNTVIWGRVSKIAQKKSYDIWMFPKSLRNNRISCIVLYDTTIVLIQIQSINSFE